MQCICILNAVRLAALVNLFKLNVFALIIIKHFLVLFTRIGVYGLAVVAACIVAVARLTIACGFAGRGAAVSSPTKECTKYGGYQ